MDMAVFVELIGTLGFPIALVIVLCWFIFKIYKASEKREAELRQEIKENREINGKFAEIITQHTAELTEIKTDIREIKNTLEIGT
jgi:F0F1-type ATP synthase membrane subunit b/b'